MDVLFAMPPGGGTGFVEHLGAAFLRAVLARNGITARQYLPDRAPSLGGFASFLSEHRPALVGFTLYEANLRATRALARVVRATLPEAVIALGGPNATFSPDEALALVDADVAVRGAAEGTIPALAAAAMGSPRPRRHLVDALAAVPNLVVRAEGETHRTRVGDLSSFPSEHFATLDDVPSPYQDGVVASADIGLLTSRGCNQACTYCSFAAVSGRRVRYHGVDRVLDDIAALHRIARRGPARRVPFYDDAFSLAPARALEICEGIARRGLQMPFDCGTRADRVDAKLLAAMRRAGFVGIFFGLESAVPRVLRAIGKVQDPATTGDHRFDAERAYLASVRSAVAQARAAGLEAWVSVMAGLPGESAQDFAATLAFVRSLGVERYAHNVLQVFPGTPLHEARARHGLAVSRGVTGAWSTTHAYDVAGIPPLPNSNVVADRIHAARLVSDALCGYPRRSTTAPGTAWAVVLHGCPPDAGVSAWIARVLAVEGLVVAIGSAGDRVHPMDWLSVLRGADVPWGAFDALVREDLPTGAVVLRSVGWSAPHRFVLDGRWPRTGQLAVDALGTCTVPVWLASTARSPPGRARDAAAGVQVADGCRWGSGWRRCAAPGVLHVAPDGTVRACWNGPVLGRVGDAYDALTSGSSGDVGRRCPMARAEEVGAPALAETLQIRGQLGWLRRTSFGAGRRESPSGCGHEEANVRDDKKKQLQQLRASVGRSLMHEAHGYVAGLRDAGLEPDGIVEKLRERYPAIAGGTRIIVPAPESPKPEPKPGPKPGPTPAPKPPPKPGPTPAPKPGRKGR